MKFVIVTSLLCSVFLLGTYLVYFQDHRAFKSLAIMGKLWGPSAPGVFLLSLQEIFGCSEKLLLRLHKGIRFLFLLYVFWLAWRITDTKSFLAACAKTIIAFYAIFSIYVWPWYLISFIPFIFLREKGDYTFTVVGTTFGGLLFWAYSSSTEIGIRDLPLFEKFSITFLICFLPIYVGMVADLIIKRKMGRGILTR